MFWVSVWVGAGVGVRVRVGVSLLRMCAMTMRTGNQLEVGNHSRKKLAA